MAKQELYDMCKSIIDLNKHSTFVFLNFLRVLVYVMFSQLVIILNFINKRIIKDKRSSL